MSLPLSELRSRFEHPDGAGMALHYMPKDRHVALGAHDGRLVASGDLIAAEAEIPANRLPIAGLGAWPWAGHSDIRTSLNRYGHVIPGL